MVVFPTPPFWLATAITRAEIPDVAGAGSLLEAAGRPRSAGSSAGQRSTGTEGIVAAVGRGDAGLPQTTAVGRRRVRRKGAAGQPPEPTSLAEIACRGATDRAVVQRDGGGGMLTGHHPSRRVGRGGHASSFTLGCAVT